MNANAKDTKIMNPFQCSWASPSTTMTRVRSGVWRVCANYDFLDLVLLFWLGYSVLGMLLLVLLLFVISMIGRKKQRVQLWWETDVSKTSSNSFHAIKRHILTYWDVHVTAAPRPDNSCKHLAVTNFFHYKRQRNWPRGYFTAVTWTWVHLCQLEILDTEIRLPRGNNHNCRLCVASLILITTHFCPIGRSDG